MSRVQQGSSQQANYVLGLLLLAYILSFIDRNVMSVLVGPIRQDLQISDFQFSLLHGFAFAIFYTFMGLPLGRIADLGNRRNLIAVGVFCWSLMTLLCGVARSFTALFAARIGVGVGEAALSPAAYSMLADLFAPNRLPKALAIFSMGITIGGGMAYMIGGWVFDYFSVVSVPGFEWIRPWQWTFIVVSAPGFVLTLLMLTVKEPERRGMPDAGKPDAEGLSIADVLRFVWQNRSLYGSHFVGISLLSILGYGTMAWYPEFLFRTYGLEKASGGFSFGLIFIIAGSIGAMAGGVITQWLSNRGIQDAPLRLVIGVAVALVVPACLGPLMPSSTLALVWAVPTMLLLNSYFGVAVAALQMVTPNRMRAQISALLLFMTNFFGLACGPSLVAALTDFVFGDDAALRYSLVAIAVVVAPLAAFVISRGLSAFREALSRQALV